MTVFEKETSGPGWYATKLLEMPPEKRTQAFQRVPPEHREWTQFYLDEELRCTPTRRAELIAIQIGRAPVEYRAETRRLLIGLLRGSA